jgi:Phosphotransferase enzyme family
VQRTWREHLRGYLFADSPDGRLFGRWSEDPQDEATLAHEAAMREIVGTDGPLRAPPVLERAAGWLLEEAVDPEPCEGPEAIDAVAAAAEFIPQLELPLAPARAGRGRSLRTRARILRSPLPLRELRAARRTLADPGLPPVTSHGDFHRGNVLVHDGAAWVVDWELSGRRPAGYDLMQFWATLERAEDRERLFEAAVVVVGPTHRPALLRLRHALVVRTIAGKFAAPMAFDRDRRGAHDLLELLPGIREEAGLR